MRFGPWLLAALLGVCLYAVTLRGTYIFDDEFFVRDDPRLHSVSEWPKFWTQAYFPTSQDRLYRPLTSMSYAVEWQIFGNRPWVFHLINIVLYGAVCAGAAELARILGGNALGYVAGLLFAAHPIHVEAVAYLVGRAELLSTGAMVWAMILSLGALSARRIVAIAVLFIVGLLCKEPAMLMPILIGVLFLIRSPTPRSGPSPNPGSTSRASLRKVLFLVLCWMDAAYLVGREYSKMKFSFDPGLLDWTAQPLIRAVGVDRWLIPFSVLGRYLTLLIAPYHQSIDYGYAVIGFIEPRGDLYLWIGLVAAVVGVMALVIAIAKRAWLVVWCLLGLGLSYGLISNFAGIIGTIMAERLMFLPSLFFVILIAWILLKIPRQAAMTIVIIAVVLGSVRTVVYASQWNDRRTFYQRQTAENPRSERIWWLLAGDLAQRGRYADAIAAAGHMQGIDPDYWVGWYEAANICATAGNYKQALLYLDRAWRCPLTDHLAINLLRNEIHRRQTGRGR